ncbi:Zinc finger protein 26 [Operophtera brumata]|uniref:Zinc finger protein 26 n=1 Tax=Operophtera brumata TaxID=104452 RepID=A0A0L7KSP2_OPEBR|nr:Zinc finger protein 26 [Operophtera brumata]
MRYTCKMCSHTEYSRRMMEIHTRTHLTKQLPNAVIKIEGSATKKPGDLRKLLSKTTIEGYKCLECDMFFKFHREGLQCNHCKKRFVNQTTLATHLRFHREGLQCDHCKKRFIKYHIQRHQNKTRYECADCNKLFSHLATYHAHLKYSRAHAHDDVFKFPCPMCNKGYPTKEAMQDHFNYQHLGKTSHKCPICDKVTINYQHLGKTSHKCPICDKVGLSNINYQHLGKTSHKCPICDKVGLSNYNYQHLGKTSHKCPICDKVGLSNNNYQHLGKTSHKCPICDKVGLSNYNYQHLGKTSHKCPICDKVADSVASECREAYIARSRREETTTEKPPALTQHEVIHSGARPLSCDICHQTFKQKASLYTHRKRVHKVYPARKEVHYSDELPHPKNEHEKAY